MLLRSGTTRRILTTLTFLVAVFASLMVAAAPTIQRPLKDFLSQQGTFCVDDGSGGCTLFVPPDPNFLGWSTNFAETPLRFAGVDYAGLVKNYPSGMQPVVTGTVMERPLKDGTAEVTVDLHTTNANMFVIELDLGGDVLLQIADKRTLFGHRPRDVKAGASQALADTHLHTVFINTAPGAPLPDLLAINGTPAMKFLAFGAHGHGALTWEFGVAEGTPGRCTIVQTGLFNPPGLPKHHPDLFPVEAINLQVVGK